MEKVRFELFEELRRRKSEDRRVKIRLTRRQMRRKTTKKWGSDCLDN